MYTLLLAHCVLSAAMSLKYIQPRDWVACRACSHKKHAACAYARAYIRLCLVVNEEMYLGRQRVGAYVQLSECCGIVWTPGKSVIVLIITGIIPTSSGHLTICDIRKPTTSLDRTIKEAETFISNKKLLYLFSELSVLITGGWRSWYAKWMEGGEQTDKQ